EERPYGYIYLATNKENGKKYVGQTVSSRWKEHQDCVEERWKEEVGDAYRKQNRGEELRYIENAIIKYGPENFDLKQQDVAYSQKELDEKERKWVNEYDSTNPDKGYNLTEGGRGGTPSKEVIEKLSQVSSEKWQEKKYQEKQLKERQERAKDPEWLDKMSEINRERAKDPKFIEKISEINRERAKDPEWLKKMTEINRERAKDPKFIEKMTEINRERAKDPEYQKKMSNSLKEKWQEPEYQKSVSKGVSKKWQEPEYRERQMRAKREGKREIRDKRQFLKDIQEMKKKDINTKYDMDGKSINKRIEGMLGKYGVKNYSEAREYLQDKNIDDVLKEIEEKTDNREKAVEEPNEQSTEESIEELKEESIEELSEEQKEEPTEDLIEEPSEELSKIC
ncbi:MAG: hypothetical protein ACFFAN_14125, partial [Promethearchaeota archaeon]